MKKSLIAQFFMMILCGMTTGIEAQKPSSALRIMPGSNHLVPYAFKKPLVEPYLAVNPQNQDHMVAVAIVYDSAATSDIRTHIAIFTTKNNGKFWKQTDLQMTVGFDPWIAIRNNNDVMVIALAGFGRSHGTELLYYASHDGGDTWDGKPVSLGRSHDHPTLTVDRSRNDRLYLLSNQGKRNHLNQQQFAGYLNFSDDWIRFRDSGSYFYPAGANNNTLTAVVNSKGTVLLPYLEFTVTDNHARAGSISMVHSVDGKSFSPPVLITGKTAVGKGFPVMAVDRTGQYKDRAYLVKNSGVMPTRSEGLYLQYSDDYKIWSEEVRVDHNDAKEKFIRTAAIDVNSKGIIGIAWVDRRNDTALKKNDIYFTASCDGGRTFANEVRVTEVSSDPLTAANGKAAQRHFSGGDYMACVAKSDGSFQLLWADSRSGIYELYTANVVVENR